MVSDRPCNNHSLFCYKWGVCPFYNIIHDLSIACSMPSLCTFCVITPSLLRCSLLVVNKNIGMWHHSEYAHVCQLVISSCFAWLACPIALFRHSKKTAPVLCTPDPAVWTISLVPAPTNLSMYLLMVLWRSILPHCSFYLTILLHSVVHAKKKKKQLKSLFVLTPINLVI